MLQLHSDSACVVLVASPTNDPNPDSHCLWLPCPLVSVPPCLSCSPHLPTGTCSLRPVKGGRFLAHALLLSPLQWPWPSPECHWLSRLFCTPGLISNPSLLSTQQPPGHLVLRPLLNPAHTLCPHALLWFTFRFPD